jgi:hypothetical protein
MDFGRPSQRAILAHMTGAVDQHRLGVYLLVVALVCAIGMVMLGLNIGPAGKIDANRLVSPRDRSAAPPAFLSRASVRVIANPQPHRAPKPRHRGPARRTKALQ